jgi:hypothetical protein
MKRFPRAAGVMASLLLSGVFTVPGAEALVARSSHRHKSVTHAATAPSMAPERATQIQTALIKAGYMTGVPNGTWDASSNAAMQKYQGDNGWQTKLTPDSRALIKLGLGPQTDGN